MHLKTLPKVNRAIASLAIVTYPQNKTPKRHTLKCPDQDGGTYRLPSSLTATVDTLIRHQRNQNNHKSEIGQGQIPKSWKSANGTTAKPG